MLAGRSTCRRSNSICQCEYSTERVIASALTIYVHAECKRRSPQSANCVASPLQFVRDMKFQTLTIEQLSNCNGGVAMDPAAKWIMQHESGGSPTAGHLHSQGRGDGTRGNQSSAFGAFQMIQSTRKQYMGKDYQSTDLGKQYAAATKYVDQRYGSWSHAESFWKSHRWY
jgi:Transglycosylase SLT domain